MICIYCLRDRQPEMLSDEHVIPKALGGWLSLGKGACRRCNDTVVNSLDHFLSIKFPPTSLARTDLGLRSYSGASPTTILVARDDVIGPFEIRITPGGKARIKPSVSRRGNSLFVVARSMDEGVRVLAKAMKVRPEDVHPTASGIIKAGQYHFKETIDWRTANRAAAKIFYCYALLELGESALATQPAQMLRDYVLGKGLPTIPIGSRIGRGVPFAGGGTLEVPQHHHIVMFDAAEADNNWVCLFGLLWFAFPYDLSEWVPHGRMIGMHPQQRRLAEALTKLEGRWHFRRSVKFGWQRPGTSAPEIPRS